MVGYFMSFIRDFPPDTVNMTTAGVIATGRALCSHNSAQCLCLLLRDKRLEISWRDLVACM